MSRRERDVSFSSWRTRQLLAERGQADKEPSRATMFRLFSRLSAGRHTTGSAVTRRGLAGRPQRMFSQAYPAAPGELMEIDSTPLDVMVLLDDGVPGRVELTGMIDVATRTVPGGSTPRRRSSTRACCWPARSRPSRCARVGQASLAMAHSALPYDRLLGINERLRHAAARPVIVPDTIVIDHGSVFVSGNFRSSCSRRLGISIHQAHLATGSDKPHMELFFLRWARCPPVRHRLPGAQRRPARRSGEGPVAVVPDPDAGPPRRMAHLELAQAGPRRAKGPAAPAADVLPEQETRPGGAAGGPSTASAARTTSSCCLRSGGPSTPTASRSVTGPTMPRS